MPKFERTTDGKLQVGKTSQVTQLRLLMLQRDGLRLDQVQYLLMAG